MPRPCVIFDLDGTLADIGHRLHFIEPEYDNQGNLPKKNWPAFFDACVHDKPVPYVIELARVLRTRYYLFVCTGRPDSHLAQTAVWFKNSDIPYDQMMMRKAGDYRPDTVVKVEMLGIIRATGYDPAFAVDDRPDVVRMWRENGVPCFVVDDSSWYKK